MFVGKIVILASFSSTWIMLKSWMPTILWYYIRYLHIIHGKFSYVVKERRTALWSKHATLSRTSHSFKLPIVPYLIFFQRGWTDITSLNTISLTLNKEENSQLALVERIVATQHNLRYFDKLLWIVLLLFLRIICIIFKRATTIEDDGHGMANPSKLLLLMA